MANDFYNHGTAPGQGALASSAQMRSEFDAVQSGFDKLPPLTGNAGKTLKVNASGTGIEAVTVTAGLPVTTAILKGDGVGGAAGAAAGTDYQAPIGTISGLAKGNGANALTSAADGTDYLSPTTGIKKTASTGSAPMPTGTTGERDGSPSVGMFRYNTTLSQFEGYGASGWGQVGGGAVGGSGNPAFYENDITITADYTITTNKNAMTAGPVTINSGVTITVPSGSTWTVV